MSRRLVLQWEGRKAMASLGEGPTAQALWNSLPLEGQAQVWGQEIYFEIPLEAALEPEAQAQISVGDLAYWPPGRAFCIFFGPTPASRGDLPEAASPVNGLGRLEEVPGWLGQVGEGETIRLEAAA